MQLQRTHNRNADIKIWVLLNNLYNAVIYIYIYIYINKQNSIRLVLASTYLNNTQLTFF